MNCTENSYNRLGSCKAPCYIAWGYENRSTFIRMPATTTNSTRMEIRTADCECNPYIVFTLLIYAALDGIKNNLVPPEAVKKNLFEKDSNCPTLPDTLDSAKKIAEKSSFIKEALGF